MYIKRVAAVVSAAAMWLTGVSWTSFAADEAAEGGAGDYTSFPYTIEAEDMTDAEGNKAQLWTKIYENEVPGYSGEGFVYLTSTPYKMTVNVEEDGMYDVKLRAAQILSNPGEGRQQSMEVNGVKYTKIMPYSKEWTDFDFGFVRLKKGENEIKLTNEYGYMAVDTVTVDVAKFPDISGASDTPCDPKATESTKSVMKYLKSVYGKNIISGQQEIYGGGNTIDVSIRYDAASNKVVDDKGNEYTFDPADVAEADDHSKFVWKCYDKDGKEYSYDQSKRSYHYNDYEKDDNLIYDMTGKYPAIHGFDFGSYCPCYAWDDGVAKRMIQWGKKGGIITSSWHINVPTKKADYTLGEPLDFSKTTYTQKTDFVTANCMKEGTMEYDYFQLCMKNLAAEIKKVQDAGYPIIFRPFHEAEGNGGADGSGAWFWWSKEGTEVYKELWKLLYTTLTEKYGLHNLIWEQNLYAWSDDSAKWYVGDDWVDIVGFDKYNVQYNRHDGKTEGPNLDSESGIFWNLNKYVSGNKMVSMPENDSVPSLDNLKIEQAKWLYFCIWYDTPESPFVSGEKYQNKEELKKLYTSDYCITLDELPNDLYSGTSEVVTTTAPNQTTAPEVTTTTKEPDKTTISPTTTTTVAETTTEKPDETTTTSVLTTKPDETTTAEPETPSGVIPEAKLLGDVNDDGADNISDVILLNKYIVRAANLTPQGYANADCYKTSETDNVITVQDSITLLKYLINIYSSEDLPIIENAK